MSEEIDFSMDNLPPAETTPERLERVDLIRSLQLENAKLRAKVQAADEMRAWVIEALTRLAYENLFIAKAINNYDRS